MKLRLHEVRIFPLPQPFFEIVSNQNCLPLIWQHVSPSNDQTTGPNPPSPHLLSWVVPSLLWSLVSFGGACFNPPALSTPPLSLAFSSFAASVCPYLAPGYRFLLCWCLRLIPSLLPGCCLEDTRRLPSTHIALKPSHF